jgi:hypothetical protein
MKMQRLLGVLGLFWLAACQSLPAITPAPPEATPPDRNRGAPFVQQPWRMVHSIASQWPGGGQGFMLGVLNVRPATGRLDCAVLSLEGLLLFEARYADGRLAVARALPPFHHPQMAERMLADIRLLFLAPADKPLIAGVGPDGHRTRRYASPPGTIDVSRIDDENYTIRRFDARHRLQRQVEIEVCRPPGSGQAEAVPCKITLKSRGPGAYRLDMVLTEASPLADDPTNAGRP